MAILTAQAWPDNGAMIADVAKLGYLKGRVLDATYGYGIFWNQWNPPGLIGCDLVPSKVNERGVVADFTNLPFADHSFDSVVCDPPYKYTGTPTPEVDERYGVHVYTRWQDRRQLILDGISECSRVTRNYFLLKCQDQVVSGAKRWQTIEFSNHAATLGLTLEDRFDMLTTPRPQPGNRRQVHSLQNYSTLLIFQKK